MAKYSKIYENGIEKHELMFRGTAFDFSMLPDLLGRKSDKCGFSYQITEKYPDVSQEDLKEAGIEDLWWEDDEDEIFEILTELDKLEN